MSVGRRKACGVLEYHSARHIMPPKLSGVTKRRKVRPATSLEPFANKAAGRDYRDGGEVALERIMRALLIGIVTWLAAFA